MKKFKAIIITFALAVGFVPFTLPAVAGAVCNDSPAVCAGRGTNTVTIGTQGEGNINNAVRDVVNILLYIIGAAAVIMLVIGGIRYTISQGDSGQIKSAKDTILYAVIGLVVALLAYAIVNFVLRAFN